MLGPKAASAVIERTKGFTDAKEVKLFVCDSGKGDNSIAQKSANIIGKPVSAPTEFIWTDKKGGTSVYGGKIDPKTNEWVKDPTRKGEWRLFRPQGSETKQR